MCLTVFLMSWQPSWCAWQCSCCAWIHLSGPVSHLCVLGNQLGVLGSQFSDLGGQLVFLATISVILVAITVVFAVGLTDRQIDGRTEKSSWLGRREGGTDQTSMLELCNSCGANKSSIGCIGSYAVLSTLSLSLFIYWVFQTLILFNIFLFVKKKVTDFYTFCTKSITFTYTSLQFKKFSTLRIK